MMYRTYWALLLLGIAFMHEDFKLIETVDFPDGFKQHIDESFKYYIWAFLKQVLMA